MKNLFLTQTAEQLRQRLRLQLGEPLSDLSFFDSGPLRHMSTYAPATDALIGDQIQLRIAAGSLLDRLALELNALHSALAAAYRPMPFLGNKAPSGSVTVTGSALQGQTLQASHTLADANGLGAIAYQWFANGVAISGATGTTLLLTQSQVGQQISVRASYLDGGGTRESVTSKKTALVVNVNDLPTGSVTITGMAKQGETLTASNSLADADGFSLASYRSSPTFGTIAYQWLADGVSIGGATGSSLVLTQAHVGRHISVRASYRDGGWTQESVTSAQTASIANINDLPTGSVTIAGTAMQGQTLKASHALADADGLGAIALQWFADGVAISGATDTTLLLTQAQVGRQISVRASYRDGGASVEAVTSAPTVAVINVNEAPTANEVHMSLDEDGEYAFSTSSFDFRDAAGESGALAGIVVGVLPHTGLLTLDDVAMSTGRVVAAADLGRLVYRPGKNLSGEHADRWTFRARDDGGTANGGVDTATSDSVMSVTLRAVNDAPASADVVRMAVQNAPLAFAHADFTCTDPSDHPANSLLAVRIITLPGRGTLSLDGVAVTAGQSIAAEQLERLTYTAKSDPLDLAVDRYTFAVQDNGGTERKGADVSQTHTMTLNVVAPVALTLTLDPIAGDGILDRLESGRGLRVSGRLSGLPQLLDGHEAASIALSIVDLDDPSRPAIKITAHEYVSATGLWAASLDAERLADGHRHQITVTTTGSGPAAGLSSSASANLRVDRSAPTATVADDVTGSIATGIVGYTITFSEPVSGFDIGDIASPNGTLGALTWDNGLQARFTVTPADRTQGDNLGVRIGTDWQDAVGNLATTAPALRTLAWDRLQPNTPVMALADDTGTSNTDGITRLGTVQVTGLESGATWQYALDGSTWQDGTGSSFTLPAGTHAAARVKVRQTDAAGHVSAYSSNAQAWTVDMSVARPSLRLSNDSGIYSDDGYTRDSNIHFSGLETNGRREISVDAGLTWAVVSTNTFSLPDGTYAQGAVLARQVDVAGNISVSSAPLQAFTFDTFSAAPKWSLVVDSGIATNDGISRFGTLLLDIEAGSTWQGSIDGGLTWTSGNGTNWTLPEGRYAADKLRIKQTDLAGNGSEYRGNAKAVHIDQSIAAPKLALQADTGRSSTDFMTRDGRVLVQGLDTDDTWSWSVDGTTWTTGIAQALELPAGIHTLRVRSEDAAGNQANAMTMALTVDTTSPALPVLALVEDSAPTGDGHSTNGLIQVSRLEAQVDWEYTLNGGLDWQTGSGTTFMLPIGVHHAADVQVRQVDRAGNVSSTGQLAADVTIDSSSGPSQPRLQDTWLDNAINIDVASAIVLDFGAVDLRAVAGMRILLVDDGGNASNAQAYALESATHTQVFDVTGAAVSVSGGRVTLTPSRHLDLASRYHVELDAGAFVDRSSGQASKGWADASVLNFETVRPGAIGSAAESWRMAADATRQASHRWIDLSGSGDSASNRVVTSAADGGAFVHVFADRTREPAYSALGFDGIGTDDFNVRITGFGADDLLYVDDQGRTEDINDLTYTLMLAGTNTTTLYYGPGQDKPDGLGGQIAIELAGGLAAFGSRAEWQTSLGLTTSPYVIA